MLKRNHRRIDEALWQHHFQDILSSAQQKSEFQLKNTFYEFIPTSSSSQLGLDQLWALISLDNPLQAGEVIKYDGSDWLTIFEERNPTKAYRKLIIHKISEYIMVDGVLTPFVFQGSLKGVGKLDTFLKGFLSADTLEYVALALLPINPNTEKIKRYFQFRYADSQWKVNTKIKNVLPGIIALTISEVPLNDDIDNVNDPITDKEEETFDYRIEVQGENTLLVDETISHTVYVYDKSNGAKVDIPFRVEANNSNIELINTQINEFQIIGKELGESLITITTANNEISTTIKVEVISLW